MRDNLTRSRKQQKEEGEENRNCYCTEDNRCKRQTVIPLIIAVDNADARSFLLLLLFVETIQRGFPSSGLH